MSKKSESNQLKKLGAYRLFYEEIGTVHSVLQATPPPAAKPRRPAKPRSARI